MGNASSSKSIMIAGAKDRINIGESPDSVTIWAAIKAEYIEKSIEKKYRDSILR